VFDYKYAFYKLQDLHLANPTRPRLLVYLPEWLKAWEDRRNDYNNLDNDIIITSRSRTTFFRKRDIIIELEELEIQLGV
jgi:hypothetical protein